MARWLQGPHTQANLCLGQRPSLGRHGWLWQGLLWRLAPALCQGASDTTFSSRPRYPALAGLAVPVNVLFQWGWSFIQYRAVRAVAVMIFIGAQLGLRKWSSKTLANANYWQTAEGSRASTCIDGILMANRSARIHRVRAFLQRQKLCHRMRKL